MFFVNGCGDDISSQAVAHQVLSALKSLTSVFGMRTGGTSSPLSPQWWLTPRLYGKSAINITVCHNFANFVTLLVEFRNDKPQGIKENLFCRHCFHFDDRYVVGALPRQQVGGFALEHSCLMSLIHLKSDQALDRLVSVSWTHYCAYTSDLSTLLSTRGLSALSKGYLILW